MPDGEELVRGGIFGRFDRVVLEDEGVEFDDFAVGVEHVDGKQARNAGGKGSVGRVLRFAHLVTCAEILLWKCAVWPTT